MATLMSFRFGHSDSYTDTIIANVDERSTGACSAPPGARPSPEEECGEWALHFLLEFFGTIFFNGFEKTFCGMEKK